MSSLQKLHIPSSSLQEHLAVPSYDPCQISSLLLHHTVTVKRNYEQNIYTMQHPNIDMLYNDHKKWREIPQYSEI